MTFFKLSDENFLNNQMVVSGPKVAAPFEENVLFSRPDLLPSVTWILFCSCEFMMKVWLCFRGEPGGGDGGREDGGPEAESLQQGSGHRRQAQAGGHQKNHRQVSRKPTSSHYR